MKPEESEFDLSSLFKDDVPLIDVRAPVEFKAGHFPSSVNLPLLNDEERRLIGICYKEKGQGAAIELGHSLVQGASKDSRVQAWVQFKRKNPNAVLYCFRGGLRSQISVEWMRDAGETVERVPGGYKAMRRYLMTVLESASSRQEFLVMGGKTGSGKTALLKKISPEFIDLEKHAHHKGSSFGIQGEQPSQVTFENRIAVDFLKRQSSPFILFEDESIMIGSLNVPKVLFNRMQNSPLVVLEKEVEERARQIAEEYVIERLKNQKHSPESVLDFMKKALVRIEKKLGGLQCSRILKQMTDAFGSARVLESETHLEWVTSLLVHYYDPFYERALKRHAPRIVFHGNERQCTEWIRGYSSKAFDGRNESW